MKSIQRIFPILVLAVTTIVLSSSTCKYGFSDASPIPAEIKTFKVQYLENKAQYVNPSLSPQLTEKLTQKISGTTRLRGTNNDEADYNISGYVKDYYVTTMGVANNTTSKSRLNVSFHLVFKNNVEAAKNFETDITRSIDFDANKTLNEVESTITRELVNSLADDIFNKIFSNW